MVTNIAGIVATGGASAAARTGARVAARTATKAVIKSQIKARAQRMGRRLAENTVENAAHTMYMAQQTGEFNFYDLDPTGIANVVHAYNKPLCANVR